LFKERSMSARSATLIVMTLVAAADVGGAQSAPTSPQMSQAAFARVTYHQVPPGSEAEFERFMKAAWRPIFQAQLQAGRASNWILYRVHLTGLNDEYNYASVTYHETWAKTEASASWSAVVRDSNPVSAKVMIDRTRDLGPVVRQALYGRVDFVTRSSPQPFRYAVLDFMKVKEGMIDEYLKVEREDWKPLHQVLTKEGNRVGWALWDYMVPGGTGSPHDFVTTMLFNDYQSIKAANDAEAYKRAHPNGDLAASVARTRKSRDVVRTEIWEVVDTLN
jgi:L-rhamnose mutarotase